ncbi:MAG: hypothetical protein K0T99_01625 [Alphaproteobacteria bacterium]|nr:hypothetical protein [Alphaproteobacteria bacterium]
MPEQKQPNLEKILDTSRIANSISHIVAQSVETDKRSGVDTKFFNQDTFKKKMKEFFFGPDDVNMESLDPILSEAQKESLRNYMEELDGIIGEKAEDLGRRVDQKGIKCLKDVTWKSFLDSSFKKMGDIVKEVFGFLSAAFLGGVAGLLTLQVSSTLATDQMMYKHFSDYRAERRDVLDANVPKALIGSVLAGGAFAMNSYLNHFCQESPEIRKMSEDIEKRTQVLIEEVVNKQEKPEKVSQVDWDKSPKERESAIKQKLSSNIAKKKSFVDRFLGRNKKGPNKQR